MAPLKEGYCLHRSIPWLGVTGTATDKQVLPMENRARFRCAE
jgi:hypothetical protein